MYTSVVLCAALVAMAAAQTCDPTTCVLPNCRCFDDPDPPGKLEVSDTPQIVMITMEGAINNDLLTSYLPLFDVPNPNGCASRGTFFIQDSGTDYSVVRSLATSGHEIGVQSEDGSIPTDGTSWIKAIKKVKENLGGIGVDVKEVLGVRAPQFSFGGDAEFIGIGDGNMLYDSSCGSNARSNKEGFKWPFTLDTVPVQPLCDFGSNVTLPFPGRWVAPVDDLHDLDGTPALPCIAPSGCRNITTKQNAFDLFYNAFADHYTGKRTPFLMVVDPTWAKNKDLMDGTVEFLQYIRAAFGDDVWTVPVVKALQWVQTPTPIANLTMFEPWGCS